MSKFHWEGNGGGTKSDYNDGRNWLDDSGTPYAQARYPGSIVGTKDEVLFDTELVTGALSPLGYDASAKEDLLTFRVGSDYDGAVASSGFLKLKVESSMTIDGQSSGVINIESVGILTLRVEASKSTMTLKGTVSDALFFKGLVVLDAATTFSSSLTIGFLASKNDLTLTIPAGVTIPAVVNMYGGKVTNSNAITLLDMTQGTWTQVTGTMTKIVMANGKLVWTDGTITEAIMYGGKIDGSLSIAARELTYAEAYGSASIDMNNGQSGTITIGDHILVEGGNTNIEFCIGDKITNIIGGGDLFYSAIWYDGAPNTGNEFDNHADASAYLTNLGANESKTLLIKTATYADASAGSYPAGTEIYAQLGVSGISGNVSFAGECKITGDITTGNITNSLSAAKTTLIDTIFNDLAIQGNVDARNVGCNDVTQTVTIAELEFSHSDIIGDVVMNSGSIFKASQTDGVDVTAVGTGKIFIDGGSWNDITSADGGNVDKADTGNIDLNASANVTDCICLDLALYDRMTIKGGNANSLSQPGGAVVGLNILGIFVDTSFTSLGLDQVNIAGVNFGVNLSFANGDTGTMDATTVLGALAIFAIGALADSNNTAPVQGIHAGYNSLRDVTLAEGINRSNNIVGAIT